MKNKATIELKQINDMFLFKRQQEIELAEYNFKQSIERIKHFINSQKMIIIFMKMILIE